LSTHAVVVSSLGVVICCAGCRRTTDTPRPPLVAQVAGAMEIDGLSGAVRIVRDRWGVPHIYAQSRDDLFFAQGFVQAQDRLFQMDLWRRSVQGRLSEVLGANFMERDAMTRRVQFRGDIAAEWAAYGADTRAIATAFVRGINAWVALARERPPEAFVLAGWLPDAWSPSDLLNRTDAFIASDDAIDEIRRAGFSGVIADAVRRVGTPPFFSGLAAPVHSGADASENGVVRPSEARPDVPASVTRGVSRASTTRGGVLSVSEASPRLSVPAERYVVHLKAPGWNVIGTTRPWLPGVVAGHNERIAWAPAPIPADTQDVYVEASAAVHRTITKDAIVVKGRKTPFEFEIEQTPHGVIIAADREHDRVFTLRWSGTEPGAAAELGAVALNRAASWAEVRGALVTWRMPARRVLYADIDGNIGFQDAALVPIRQGREWNGWTTLDDLPHAYNPRERLLTSTDRQAAADRPSEDAWFAHLFAITAPARTRFNIGPFKRAPGDSVVRAMFDPRDWDRSQMVVAPGQSESPDSPHFRDLAEAWARGELVPLAFSDAAVQAYAEGTLLLVPRAK
jgi:penicillin amidase